jgi:hypothetical protein
MIDLPTPRFVVDQVPAEAREWVEKTLTGPLNRFLQPLADSLKRVMLGQLNVQVLEYRGLPPTAAAPAEFPSRLTGACVGLVPIFCRQLETNGAAGAPVGALTTPVWSEVVKAGGSGATLRVTSQQTLTSTTRYLLRWLAYGN